MGPLTPCRCVSSLIVIAVFFVVVADVLDGLPSNCVARAHGDEQVNIKVRRLGGFKAVT